MGGISRLCSHAAILAEKRICNNKNTIVTFRAADGFSPDLLTDLLRQGARDLIAQAVEAELKGFLAALSGETDAFGRTLRANKSEAFDCLKFTLEGF